MSYNCFQVTIADHIAHVQLSRPQELNSMTLDFWRELPEIIEKIDQDASARVIVISSTGRHFTAGMDLSVFQSDSQLSGSAPATNRGAATYDLVRGFQRTFNCLENCRIPVLAAIQGGCIGGGVDFATACDMRYASQDAFFCIQEINIGMTADVGTFPRLTKLIPEGIARELAYTGRRMPAARAQELGLVNQVYADQEAMLSAVMTIASEIASKAPLAIYGTKHLINYSRDHSTADTLDYIGVWNASMLEPQQMAEAFSAKAEKRAANFPDLPPRRGRV